MTSCTIFININTSNDIDDMEYCQNNIIKAVSDCLVKREKPNLDENFEFGMNTGRKP